MSLDKVTIEECRELLKEAFRHVRTPSDFVVYLQCKKLLVLMEKVGKQIEQIKEALGR